MIGKIGKIHKSFAYVWNFDADGVWDESPVKVTYSEITDIIFGSRYVETFSKYVGEPTLYKLDLS